MIEQKEVTIKGEKYLMTQFGASKGIKVGKRVGRILLPIIGAAMKEGDEHGVGGIIDVIVDNLEHLDDQLIMELVGTVTKNGVAIDFDKEFAGNYDTLFLILQEVIQFNFNSLFQMGLDGSVAE